MSTDNITVEGAIVIKDLPDLACFTSFKDLLLALPNFLGVQIPKSVTNVIISNVQPLESQRDTLWIRLNNAGTFLGFYVYSEGTWEQMFPQPNGIFRMYGNSTDVPDGYVLADSNNARLPPGVGAFLQSQWHIAPGGAYYDVFDVTYVGL